MTALYFPLETDCKACIDNVLFALSRECSEYVTHVYYDKKLIIALLRESVEINDVILLLAQKLNGSAPDVEVEKYEVDSDASEINKKIKNAQIYTKSLFD